MKDRTAHYICAVHTFTNLMSFSWCPSPFNPPRPVATQKVVESLSFAAGYLTVLSVSAAYRTDAGKLSWHFSGETE